MGSSSGAAHVPDASALITVWRKSHHSNPSAECVELGPLDDGVTIAVRNSRDPYGPAVLFDCETICSFIDAVKDDRLDWVIEDYSRFEQVPGGMAVRGGSGGSGPGA